MAWFYNLTKSLNIWILIAIIALLQSCNTKTPNLTRKSTNKNSVTKNTSPTKPIVSEKLATQDTSPTKKITKEKPVTQKISPPKPVTNERLTTKDTSSSKSSHTKVKKVALVIGNSNYEHVSLLVNPAHDSEDIAKALNELDFDVYLYQDVDRKKFRVIIEDFQVRARNANVALFYFSGHGIQLQGENILIPIDLAFHSIEGIKKAISARTVQKLMQEATTGTKIMILDACRNGERTTTEESSTAGIVFQGLAPVIPMKEFIIMYSTAAGKTAADGQGRNSPYTTALLKHIKEPIPIESLFKRVARTVANNTNPPQIPANYTAGLTGDFCFTGCGVNITNPASICRLSLGNGIYEGECRDGKANGRGIQRYDDGEYYSGGFQDNLRHGKGIQYWPDGEELEGHWTLGRLD